MNIHIKQIQTEEILKEHAHESFNYHFFGKYELIISLFLIFLGLIGLLFLKSLHYFFILLILIGSIEAIKFPKREKNWVKKKMKEGLYDKTVEFLFLEDTFKITINENTKEFNYKDLRSILFFKNGLLLKIHKLLYFYISYSSLADNDNKELIVAKLKAYANN